jgi:hypothetical protein
MSKGIYPEFKLLMEILEKMLELLINLRPVEETTLTMMKRDSLEKEIHEKIKMLKNF